MTWHEQVPRHERLVDSFAEDILGATDDDILASHSTAAARVVADSLRRVLRRAIGQAVEPLRGARGAPRGIPVQPDRDDEERR